MKKRDLKEEMKQVKGGEFPKWYASLTKLEKIEYQKIFEELVENFRKKK